PPLARDVTVSYTAAVADGRGGSAQGGTLVTVRHSPTSGQPPFGALSVSPSTGPTPTTVTINFPATDPAGGTVSWDLRAGYLNGTSGSCCYSAPSTQLTLNSASAYRITVQGIDPELNVSENYSTVVHVGGAVGEPPIARASVDQTTGPVPLTVNYD